MLTWKRLALGTESVLNSSLRIRDYKTAFQYLGYYCTVRWTRGNLWLKLNSTVNNESLYFTITIHIINARIVHSNVSKLLFAPLSIIFYYLLCAFANLDHCQTGCFYKDCITSSTSWMRFIQADIPYGSKMIPWWFYSIQRCKLTFTYG